MKVMLTSSLGGSNKVDGIRIPCVLIQQNGLLESLKSIWIQNANVLIVCADPSDYDKNDSVCNCLREALPMSGLSVSTVCIVGLEKFRKRVRGKIRGIYP